MWGVGFTYLLVTLSDLFEYIHVSDMHIKKIRKILSHKVGNTKLITMVVDAFRSTEINFGPIPTQEGLILDPRLRHRIGSFSSLQGSRVTSDVKNESETRDQSLMTRDRV